MFYSANSSNKLFLRLFKLHCVIYPIRYLALTYFLVLRALVCVGICAAGTFHCVFYSLVFYVVSQLDTDKPIERTSEKFNFKFREKNMG